MIELKENCDKFQVQINEIMTSFYSSLDEVLIGYDLKYLIGKNYLSEFTSENVIIFWPESAEIIPAKIDNRIIINDVIYEIDYFKKVQSYCKIQLTKNEDSFDLVQTFENIMLQVIKNHLNPDIIEINYQAEDNTDSQSFDYSYLVFDMQLPVFKRKLDYNIIDNYSLEIASEIPDKSEGVYNPSLIAPPIFES